MKDNLVVVGIAMLIIFLMITGVLFYYVTFGIVLVIMALLFGKLYVIARKDYKEAQKNQGAETKSTYKPREKIVQIRNPSNKEWWKE